MLAVEFTGLKLLAINDNIFNFQHQYMCKSMFALPAIGKIRDLEDSELRLETLEAAAAQRGLQYSTGLSALSKLVGFDKAVIEALGAFCADLHGRSKPVCPSLVAVYACKSQCSR